MHTNDIARNNIKRYRKLKKMSQKEFAEALEVTHSSVSAWETGKNSIDLNRLAQICEVLEVSLKEMLFKYEEETQEAQPSVVIGAEMMDLIEIVEGRLEIKELIWSCQGVSFNDVMIANQLLRALKSR